MNTNRLQEGNGYQVNSEVDSFTPRTMDFDRIKSQKTMAKIDEITNIYLNEAIEWANSQKPCSSRCFALILSETLAASGSKDSVNKKIVQIRDNQPYRRWGSIPQFPGWRGYQGAIEPLISKGATTDGRYTLSEGVLRLTMTESIFKGIGVKDSPGSFLEVGTLVPYELAPGSTVRDRPYTGGEALFIGSDKFGHFLSTGYEYLEAYLETKDETLAANLSQEDAEKRALFATAVRGLITEGTILGGWTSRVFSYGDLAANFAGFEFFKAVVDDKSPYFVYDKQDSTWKKGPKIFQWADFIEPAWDEGINCSSYHRSLTGDNHLQQKLVENYLNLSGKGYGDISCPVLPKSCQESAKAYEKSFGPTLAATLISPTCQEIAGGKPKHKVTQTDLGRDNSYYDSIGIYSGETIVEKAKVWCRTERDRLVKERCAASLSLYGSLENCLVTMPKVTSERFRCEMDARDFAGWIF